MTNTQSLYTLLASVAEALRADRALAVVDLESTGTNPELDRIVEITLARVEPHCGPHAIETRVNPGMPIPREASNIHGIFDVDVAVMPRFEAIAARVAGLLEGADLIGYHHRRFDVRLLAAELARCGIVHPFEHMRFVDVGQIFMQREPRTLEAAVRFFCGAEHADAHGTTADVLATLRVLLAQLARYEDLPRTVEGLDALGHDPSHVDREGKVVWRGGEACIGFGKYAGVALREVERGFLFWVLKKDFPEDTKAIVRDALAGKYPTPPAVAATPIEV